jgi:hypothetical protein
VLPDPYPSTNTTVLEGRYFATETGTGNLLTPEVVVLVE